jgi:hypothetical protein
MLRRFLVVLGATVMLFAVAAPVTADPPPESGVVVRIADDREGFGVFPDFINGYWVFSNVSRDDFCTWFADMENLPPPTNLEGDQVQLVFASDALVVRIHAGGPTALHAFAGDDPFIDPCNGSEPEAALTGHVRVRVNDNDGPNEGKRANSFGDRGQGKLYDGDGNAYRYNWVFRGVWNPDNTEFKVVVERSNLRRIG